jgi:hypothetical protein
VAKGRKNDKLKPGLSYIPKEAMWEAGKAFSFGASKYDKWNYKNGIEITRTVSAALRHIYQFMDGEDIDQESQALHLGNAIAGLAMAIDTYYNHKDKDDRSKK